MLQLLIVIELHSSRTRRGALLLCSVSIHELICDSSAHNSSCLLRGRLAVAVLDLLQTRCQVREHQIIHLESA
jgi:hypothetical protein